MNMHEGQPHGAFDEQRAPGGAERSRTLDRGLQILELLADRSDPSGMTISTIASAVGTSRPTAYRLVNTLLRRDFVHRRPDGRIALGVGINRLIPAVRSTIRNDALPLLRELADAVSATAHLTVSDADEALVLAVVEPRWTDLHVGYREGNRHPLDRGAAGRAILAGRHHAEGDNAYVSTSGELQRGAYGLAAPVPDVPGLEASVGVVLLGDLDNEAVGPHVVACANMIARRLLGRPN